MPYPMTDELEQRDELIRSLRSENERLQELLRGIDANRYWESRWRDEHAEIERLRAALKAKPRGCICPPGAEATCRGWDCPRNPPMGPTGRKAG